MDFHRPHNRGSYQLTFSGHGILKANCKHTNEINTDDLYILAITFESLAPTHKAFHICEKLNDKSHH